jgi:predicted transcriptional regulator
MSEKIQEINKRNLNESHLLRLLDRGIDDMEAGRALPLDEAFEKITDLRNKRRDARK